MNDEFFVGYQKMSAKQKRFALMLGIGMILVVSLVSALVAKTQSDPGPGLFAQKPGEEIRGLLVNDPYPHMVYVDEKGAVRTMLFVAGGKSGIEPPEHKEGDLYTASGTLFQRDNTKIIAGPSFERVSDVDARLFRQLEGEVAKPESLGQVELEGEIVDSKCYLGAMRPGSGRTHRACAQNCIAGGIPPVLVVKDKDGNESHMVLCTADQKPVNEKVLPYVAEPVRIPGRLVKRAGLLYLEFDPADIKRL